MLIKLQFNRPTMRILVYSGSISDNTLTSEARFDKSDYAHIERRGKPPFHRLALVD